MGRSVRATFRCGTVITVVLSLAAAAQPAEALLLQNGDFEDVYALGSPGAPASIPGAWQVVPGPGAGGKALLPVGWQLNGGYPGEVALLADGAVSGEHCLRLRGAGKGEAHIFQRCTTLRAGRHYKVSFSLRRGKATVQFYEYREDKGFARSQVICTTDAAPDKWRRAVAYYSTPGQDFGYASLAFAVRPKASVLIDNIAVEEITEVPAVRADAATELESVVIENDDARLLISGDGRLRSVLAKGLDKDYAVPECTERVFVARHAGRRCPATSIWRDADVLRVEFADPSLAATVKVTSAVGYFRFEVLDVQPEELDELQFILPVRLLKVRALPYVTYDDEFVLGNISVTPNSIGWQSGAAGTGSKGYTSRIAWYRGTGGIVGGVSAFVAVPYVRFLATMRRLERDTGLPSPMLDGRWLRESEPIRHSYLFATAPGSYYRHGDIDDLIRAAKIGGFGAIMLYKSSVFESMGHYTIKTRCFPEGLKTLEEVADRIHAAGLRVGLHLFGPSVSHNDPYIRPVPDDRLHYLACPPLAAAVDAEAEVLALAEQPEKLPYKVVRIGDEIVTFTGTETGTSYRLTGCLRGAYGTRAAAHAAGATVRGMLQIGARYRFFLADPDTSILNEMTERLARVVNSCDIDMVYFDGAGGFGEKCFHFSRRNYLLSKWFLRYYKAFDHDVIFQYSSGGGFGVLWHFIARAASADGHGDLKWYLDQRLDHILRIKSHFNYADIGWYGLDMHRKPDQLEYVAAKCIGVDGSISVEATVEILNSHPRAREIMEILGRYERCRLANHFPDTVKRKLREKGKDFRLLGDTESGWRLYRAHYHDEHAVPLIDGNENVWTVVNPLDHACAAAFEIERGAGQPATPADHDAADALVLADYADLSVFEASDHNQYGQFVRGPGRAVTAGGPAMAGVHPKLARRPQARRRGEACVVYSAQNTNASTAGDPGKLPPANGWCGRGKRFAEPRDLSPYKALGWWTHGDGKDETFFIQLWDSKGRVETFAVPIGFEGWRYSSFALPKGRSFDWTRVDYLILYLVKIAGDSAVAVGIGPVKALRSTTAPRALGGLELAVNDARVRIPVRLGDQQCITTDGLGTCTLWPGGMQPGRPIDVPTAVPILRPGPNRIAFTVTDPRAYRGDVSVRVSQIWPLER